MNNQVVDMRVNGLFSPGRPEFKYEKQDEELNIIINRERPDLLLLVQPFKQHFCLKTHCSFRQICDYFRHVVCTGEVL